MGYKRLIKAWLISARIVNLMYDKKQLEMNAEHTFALAVRSCIKAELSVTYILASSGLSRESVAKL